MTALVALGVPGRQRHISQLRYERKPYTNCTGFALAQCLEFGGLDIADPEGFISRGRKLTKIAEVDSKGNSQGTSVADWLGAFDQLLPWVVVETGYWQERALLDALAAGELVAAAGVKYDALPTRQRRWSKRFDGSHRFTLRGARRRGGVWQVKSDDPLPRSSSYLGDWMAWSDFKRAMRANGQVDGTRVWVATVRKGAAVGSLIRPVEVYAPAATVTVPKGTSTWTVDAATGRLLAGKPAPSKHTAGALARSNVRNYPASSPSGSFITLIGGPCDGAFVRSRDVTVTPATPPDDIATRLAEARQSGYDAAQAEYSEVDGPLYARTPA